MQGTVWTWELLDKSDAAFRKLGKKFKGVDNSIDRVDKKGKKFGKGMKDGFKEAASEIPGLNRGLSLMRNPLVLGAGAAIGFVAAAGHAVNKAREFNHEFLELRNLNLDKTEAEVESLKKSILDLSFEKGLDPNKTSKAFFDVQSATGKYGYEVEQIVGKVGKFAQVMKADFNTSIEGASKAMGVFSFGADQMDEYLASSFKTVQVGVTTFDQLAKVQTEYAGAAASAGQGFNEANKLFAVFSANNKSVDIAANKTKTAFEDLAKPRTAKGLKSIGVNIFDADKNMRKLDDIAKDIVPKLQTMSDQDWGKFKDSLGGGEGLRGLMDSLKDSGEKTLGVFEQFDETDFNWKKALENANGDLDVMSQIVDNKLTASWINFGNKITPMLIKIKGFAIDILDAAAEFAESYSYSSDGWQSKKDEDRAKRVKSIENGVTGDAALVTYLKKQGKGFNLDDFVSRFSNNPQGLASIVAQSTFSEGERKKLILNTKNANPFSDDFKKNIESEFDSIEISRMNGLSLSEILGYRKGKFIKNNTPTNKNLFDNDNPISDGGTGGGSRNGIAAGITGAADKVRNVKVEIQNLVQDFTVNKEGSALAPEDIMRVVEEALVRAVRDAELTLSE